MSDEGRVVILQSSAPRAIEWTAERLQAGGVVAIPTDTVYGIAASLAHPAALERIYDIKGRPADNPLPVLVSSPSEIERIAHHVSPDIALLLDLYWPGPLTVVLPARAGMPERVTAGGKTVGVRMPNHPLAIEVIAKAGGAIACTSANLSGEAPACTAAEVAASLGPRLDLILDGGRAPRGVASTVVETRDADIHILREGAIPTELLVKSWQELKAGRSST